MFYPELLIWILPSLNADTSIVANRAFSQKSIIEWQIVVDPDETAREPSHLDLHCFQRYLCWSVGMKGLMMTTAWIK